MTEEEAISGLMEELAGEQEPTTEPIAQEPTKEPEIKIDVAKILSDQTKMIVDQNKRIEELSAAPKEPQQPSEEDAMLVEAQQKLGIDLEQQKKMKVFLEEQEQAKTFEGQVKEFQATHKNIDLKEMGEWAKENGLEQLLNSGDINQWRVVANVMEAVAKVVDTPDPVTPTAQKGAETSVWDRTKKGENVSNIDIGMDLLKGIGAM